MINHKQIGYPAFPTDGHASDQVALDIMAQQAGHASFAAMCKAKGWDEATATKWALNQSEGQGKAD